MEGQKNHVVVTRLGDYWVTQAEARKIGAALGSAKFITLEGSMISAYSIDGILTPEQYKDNARQRGKHWKCPHGNIHGALEFCSCGKALASPAPRAELDISDEQKEINAAKSQAISEYIRKHLGSDRQALKDVARREAYVEQRSKEIIASNAQRRAQEARDAIDEELRTANKEARTGLHTRAK